MADCVGWGQRLLELFSVQRSSGQPFSVSMETPCKMESGVNRSWLTRPPYTQVQQVCHACRTSDLVIASSAIWKSYVLDYACSLHRPEPKMVKATKQTACDRHIGSSANIYAWRLASVSQSPEWYQLRRVCPPPRHRMLHKDVAQAQHLVSPSSNSMRSLRLDAIFVALAAAGPPLLLSHCRSAPYSVAE